MVRLQYDLGCHISSRTLSSRLLVISDVHFAGFSTKTSVDSINSKVITDKMAAE